MNPKLRRTLAGVMVLTCITFAGCVVAGQPAKASAKQVNPSLQREFDQQLAHARKEGLITSLEEMKAWVPAVPDDQNAAPFYRKLSYGTKLPYPRSESLDRRESEAVRKAHEILMERADDLKLLDQATQQKSLWFNRDWSTALLVPLPELGRIKAGARLLLFRSAVAKSEGHVDLAVKDVRRTLRIAEHLDQEKILLPKVVAQSIRSLVRRMLILWAVQESPHSFWIKELEIAAGKWPKSSEKDCLRADLFAVLCAFDIAQSSKGLRQIGVQVPMNFRQADRKDVERGKARVVEGFRMAWAEMDKGKSADQSRLRTARRLYLQGIRADQNVLTLLDPMGTGDEGNPFYTRPALWDACDAVLNQAAIRFLKSRIRNEKVLLAGLPSPIDGKPLRIIKDHKDYVISCVDKIDGFECPQIRIPGDVLAKAEPKLPE